MLTLLKSFLFFWVEFLYGQIEFADRWLLGGPKSVSFDSKLFTAARWFDNFFRVHIRTEPERVH